MSDADEQAATTIELLAELVSECGRGAAYELRDRFGFDTGIDWTDRPLLEARLAVALRTDFGMSESTADTDERDQP